MRYTVLCFHKQAHQVSQTLTATGRIRRPSISQVCHWVKKAWDDVTKEVVVKSFKKARMPLMGLRMRPFMKAMILVQEELPNIANLELSDGEQSFYDFDE